MIRRRAGDYGIPIEIARAILVLLMLLTFVSRLSLAFRSPERLSVRPYQEDAFYVFDIANHLAAGDGLSVDGIHPTNGVQPLIVFLYAPIFALAPDKWSAVGATHLTGAIFDTLCVLAIFLLLRRLRPQRLSERVGVEAMLASAIWALVFNVSWHNTNGLETGVYASLILLSMLAYLRAAATDRLRPWAGLGLVFGLMVLARIDGAFIVASVVLWEVVARLRERKRITSPAVAGAIAVIISSPWWVYNYTLFGSLMPTSGRSEAMIIDLPINLETTIQILADIAAMFVYTPFRSLEVWQYASWVAAAIVWVTMLIKFGSGHLRRSSVSVLAPFALGAVGLVFYYTFFFGAAHFFARYFHPLRIVWLLILSCLLAGTYRHFNAEIFGRKSSTFHIAVGFLAAAIILVNGSIYTRCFTTSTFSPHFAIGNWAASVAPAKVGMTSSGTAGFMSENVVNLDGKVDPEALQARLTGGMGSYIARSAIEYLIDWPGNIDSLVAQSSRAGVTFTLIDSLEENRIYRRAQIPLIFSNPTEKPKLITGGSGY